MRRLRAIADILLALGLVAALVFAARWTRDTFDPPERLGGAGEAVRIVDGDSLVIDGRAVRLIGIDAPELRQSCGGAGGADWPCGREAQAALRRLVRSGPITCESRSEDRYRRALVRCQIGEAGDIGEAMLREGWAIVLPRYAPPGYGSAESAAQAAARGIWRGDFDRPADWRAAQSAE
jgi:endonuclease YncB( thermonuclease family)